jgi:hypothetical protein
MSLIGKGTVLRHCGSQKITTWTNTLSFSNTISTTGTEPYTTANQVMGINNNSYMNEVFTYDNSNIWRCHFRLYWRTTMGQDNSNSWNYGSVYMYDTNNNQYWDRSGWYNGQTSQPSLQGWTTMNNSSTYSRPGCDIQMKHMGATSTGGERYNYTSTPSVTNDVIDSDMFYDHGYIDYVFGRNTFPSASCRSASVAPNGDKTSYNQTNSYYNFTTGGCPNNSYGAQPTTLYFYAPYNFPQGSVFHLYAWDSKNINPN